MVIRLLYTLCPEELMFSDFLVERMKCVNHTTLADICVAHQTGQ